MQEAVFFIRKFQSSVKVQGQGGHGGHEGDCTGGQHPYLDGSRLFQNFFLVKSFLNIFWNDLYEPKTI